MLMTRCGGVVTSIELEGAGSTAGGTAVDLETIKRSSGPTVGPALF